MPEKAMAGPKRMLGTSKTRPLQYLNRLSKMKSLSNLHHRHSLRLEGYDYTQGGLYFITLVTYHRLPLFGKVLNGEMRLNRYGQIAERACPICPRIIRRSNWAPSWSCLITSMAFLFWMTTVMAGLRVFGPRFQAPLNIFRHRTHGLNRPAPIAGIMDFLKSSGPLNLFHPAG